MIEPVFKEIATKFSLQGLIAIPVGTALIVCGQILFTYELVATQYLIINPRVTEIR